MIDPLRLLIDFAAFYSIYLILSTSLNLEYGYTGIPNFGKVLFFAGGAFVVGSLTARMLAPLAGVDLSAMDYKTNNVLVSSLVTSFLSSQPALSLAVLLSMLVLGALVGALLGWLASYPAIRLREDYLAMTLVVAGELLRIVALNYDPLVCGTLGVAVPNPYSFLGGIALDAFRSGFMLCTALVVWLATERLVNSPFGRLLRAVRDNELAAEALGKDVVKVRMTVLVLGSAMAGLAGALYAFYIGIVHPDDYEPIRTFVVWVMVVIGGAGNNLGAAIGALLYLLVDRVIAIAKYYMPPLPFDINYLSYIALGAILVLVLMYKPEGFVPERPPKIGKRKRPAG